MRTALLVAILVVTTCRPGSSEDGQPTPPDESTSITAPREVGSSEGGGVILDGTYVAGPYIVQSVADGIDINGHFVPVAQFRESSRRRRTDDRSSSFFDHIVTRLDSGAWLLGWKDTGYAMLGDSRFNDVLFILASDMPQEQMVSELESLGISGVQRSEWGQLVAAVEIPDHILAPYRSAYLEAEAANRIAHAPQERFVTSVYLLTVFGMAATVFALGTCLSYRPMKRMRWSQLNTSEEAVETVLRSIAVLVGLAILDLICTMLSARTSSFWELNPLGAVVISAPMMLIGFKLGTTFLSGSLLFLMRRYHGAQVASWWLALFCTVLAIRWVTYNSMLLT